MKEMLLKVSLFIYLFILQENKRLCFTKTDSAYIYIFTKMDNAFFLYSFTKMDTGVGTNVSGVIMLTVLSD